MAEVAPAPSASEAGPSNPSPPPPADPQPPPQSNGDTQMADGTQQKQDEEDKEQLPEGASEVVYVNNLNEKIKLPIMKQSLKVLFREYGSVLGVTAHRNIRMRGQAFITLDSKEAAAKAVSEVQKFPLYGKPMQLTFARTESDALVKKRHPEDMDTHKAERLERKKLSRKNNPLRRKVIAQKEAQKKAAETGLPATSLAATSAPRRIVQMPDEYLPPNKILFVQNLPDDTTKEGLEALFRPYPNLLEVRTIPGRKNIAFIEFTDDHSSGTARDALHNTKFSGTLGAGAEEGLKIKVTFAKRG
ncbi:hypothetical protein JCM11641_002277 [Rhodosporidiobolus odoratus]